MRRDGGSTHPPDAALVGGTREGDRRDRPRAPPAPPPIHLPPHPALRTPLGDLVGVRYPIVQTGMGYVSGPELAAATAAAGGLGILECAGPFAAGADLFVVREGDGLRLYGRDAVRVDPVVSVDGSRHLARVTALTAGDGPLLDTAGLLIGLSERIAARRRLVRRSSATAPWGTPPSKTFTSTPSGPGRWPPTPGGSAEHREFLARHLDLAEGAHVSGSEICQDRVIVVTGAGQGLGRTRSHSHSHSHSPPMVPGSVKAFTEKMRIPDSGFDAMHPGNVSPLVVWPASADSGEVTGRVSSPRAGRSASPTAGSTAPKRSRPALDAGGGWPRRTRALDQAPAPTPVYGA
ncbi:nitronate monooxygenase [Streptomyces sp. NPDC055681]